MSRKKSAAIAVTIVVAAFVGLVAYSATRVQEAGPAPVLTTIDRHNESDDDGTTIAEDAAQQSQQQDKAGIIANNTVIANNTIIINKPVYRNNTIIYQPLTINLDNYRTTINQHVELKDVDRNQPVDKSHSITIHAKRIQSEGWSKKFVDDRVGIFAAVYDINGNLVKTGYADEQGFTAKGLENKLYFVYPADCNDCSNSKNDILFKQWEDGSKDRPRLVPADSDVTASYRLVVPEKPKLVPLIPPPETETAAQPEITLAALNATYVYGWVQVTVQVENKVEGYNEIVLNVYAPSGELQDNFNYSDQQGFFASRETGEGDYRIVATYKYDKGVAKGEITHHIKFAVPEFANLEATEDSGNVRIGGLLKGGLAGENITIAILDPDDQPVKQYAMSFGTKPIFTLFLPSEEASTIFNKTDNYTFVVTHLPTGVQANATLSFNSNETETSAASPNLSDNAGKSEHADVGVNGSNVYVVWQDDTSGQHEILFARSGDSGATFSEPVVIGKSEQDGLSITPDIAVSGGSVYVVWADYDSQEQSAVAFRSSNDSGKTFGSKMILGNYSGENAHPHVAVFGNDIYVSWITNAQEEFTGDLLIARSTDGGAFESTVVSKDAIGAVMASSNSSLYLAWRHHPSGDTTKENTNMFASSSDGSNFETFGDLQDMTIYAIAASANNVYVAGTANDTVVLARSSDGTNFNIKDIGNGTSPHVAVSGGNVYVVWMQDGGIFLAASSDGGNTFGEAENVGSDEGFWPNVAAAGNVYVAWTETSDIMIAVQ
ncbi:MAG TPA: hypothetical protein VGQ13_01130 [Nitrososphaera sp.]|nr:hypothetical protein [Nitrososphaera sp.]